MSKRPPGLVAIICYKAFTATLFTITSISIFLTLKHYQEIRHFAYSLSLECKRGVIAWIVAKIIDVNPKTLKFGGFVAAAYALLTAIEGVGLWYQKTWAKWLVIAMVGISIPAEVYELIKGLSFLKVFAFVVNIFILFYLLRKN